MRIKMLPSLVIRLVVGTFMVVHSAGMLWAYDVFVKELLRYKTTHVFFNREFFVLGASLIPFVEFAIGLILILGIYFNRAVIFCSIVLLFHFLFDFANTSRTNQLLIILSFAMVIYMMFQIVTKQKDKIEPFRQL